MGDLNTHMATAFAHGLEASLDRLDGQAAVDFQAGATLGPILDRYLREVEDAAESDLLTSILLIDDDGKHLVHGAAPSLPADYCTAIDGIAIGPAVGSCGTAAYVGHSIFVTDIDKDPLWADFRDLAGEAGLRACWSTPIHKDGRLLGTFAIYHRTPRAPNAEEMRAVHSISKHVADAIARWR